MSAGSELSPGGNIYLTLGNALSAVFVCTVADEVNMAVIEKKRGVDAVLVYENRVRPFAVDVIGADVEIPVYRGIGSHHIESSLVIADSRRINAG